MKRRSLLTGLGLTALGAAATPGLGWSIDSTLAQEPTRMTKEHGPEEYPWGGPVLDMHFHSRKTPEADFLHLDGAGETVAVLLTRVPDDVAVANETIGQYLGRFFLFTSVDVMRADAVEILRKSGFAGTRGFGELSGWNLAIDGPEMGRIYDLAAEMQMPVLTHYQDYPYGNGSHAFLPPKGFTRPQFSRLEAALKAHPKTTFIGHGPAFWANIGPNNSNNYPSGPVAPGGLTEKLLSDYSNLYGGLDALSGVNALHRDSEFAKDFLTRHQNKLLFGSDCSCIDGRGAGQRIGGGPQAGSSDSAVTLIAGKCLARVQLTQLKELTSPDIFRKITWENGTTLLKLPV